MNYEVIYYVLLVTLLGIALHAPTLTLIQLVRQCVPVVSLIDNSLTLYTSTLRGRYDRVNGSLYRAHKDEQSRHGDSDHETTSALRNTLVTPSRESE